MEGVTLTIEVAQLEALIEALNKALTLDLKRLTFFCDEVLINRVLYCLWECLVVLIIILLIK